MYWQGTCRNFFFKINQSSSDSSLFTRASMRILYSFSYFLFHSFKLCLKKIPHCFLHVIRSLHYVFWRSSPRPKRSRIHDSHTHITRYASLPLLIDYTASATLRGIIILTEPTIETCTSYCLKKSSLTTRSFHQAITLYTVNLQRDPRRMHT